MTVTEKGQVTIPLAVREALGIRPACHVEFQVVGDHAILRKVAEQDEVAERLLRYRDSADAGMSTEQILALTRR